ncbi:MAG TPA: LytTR family DNA-binding domain-containing protein [Saprospiraceae bacterium]|nr:LytTR family DNA-binding domain-containing protein [Saprospiraceae bacterium]
MNILIVEDEALSARRLKTMVTEMDPTYRVLDITESVRKTVQWLQSHPSPDLMLMDIELTDGKSFDIFEQITVKCPVIFVTAYDEYAIKAFKVNSIDYLLKPIKLEELARSMDKLRQLQQQYTQGSGGLNIQSLLQAFEKHASYRERFLIKQADRLLPIETTDIAYFQTSEKVNYIHTFDNNTYAIDQPLDEIEKTLDPKKFFRANRQFIVSAAAVEKIHFWFSSKLKVDLRPKSSEDVMISREKAMAFRTWLGE